MAILTDDPQTELLQAASSGVSWSTLADAWTRAFGYKAYAWEGEPPPGVPISPQAWELASRAVWAYPSPEAPSWVFARWDNKGLALSCSTTTAALAQVLVQLAFQTEQINAVIQEQEEDTTWAKPLSLSQNFLAVLCDTLQTVDQPLMAARGLIEEILTWMQNIFSARDVFVAFEELPEEDGHPPQRTVFALTSHGRTLARYYLQHAPESGQILVETDPLAHEAGGNPATNIVSSLPVSEPLRGVFGMQVAGSHEFSHEAKQRFALLGRQWATFWETLHRYRTQARSQRIEQELRVARQIQDSLLPRRLPQGPDFEVAAFLDPASIIGGDFYDVQQVGSRLFMMLGDVAGKGVPAAMLIAMFLVAFRSAVHRADDALSVMHQVHQQVAHELDRLDTFVTLAILVINLERRTFTYVNAGHTESYWLRWQGRRVKSLPATGLPLGSLPLEDYEQLSGNLRPGDIIWLYSDGVTEVTNREGYLLGRSGLLDILLATQPAHLDQQIDAIRRAVALHRDGLPREDDMALLAFRIPAPQMPQLSWTFVGGSSPLDVSALTQQLARHARSWSHTFAASASSEERDMFLFAWELAVAELLTNIARHAYRAYPGRIQGSMLAYPDRLVLEVWDYGEAFDTDVLYTLPSQPDPENIDGLAAEGYGLTIIRQAVDRWAHNRRYRRNWWRLEKFWPRGRL
ncbi:MAG: SpoIIE family protein phosphatase [Chloroflexi bacterium]|nr:SpoIIE family protein phosphatase [Chloroflexota bacterium]